MTLCKFCSRPFEPRDARHLYCSPICRSRTFYHIHRTSLIQHRMEWRRRDKRKKKDIALSKRRALIAAFATESK